MGAWSWSNNFTSTLNSIINLHLFELKHSSVQQQKQFVLVIFSRNNMYQHAISVGVTFHSNQLSTSSFEVPLRNYRRTMKPRLPRKITAPSRINLNRFWNELEEFYNRYDDRKAKNNNNPIISHTSISTIKLPAYTTDTFDHEREAAENLLNERLELAPINQKDNNISNIHCCDCCCSCEFDNHYS